LGRFLTLKLKWQPISSTELYESVENIRLLVDGPGDEMTMKRGDWAVIDQSTDARPTARQV
jgi:hypothetical protein